MQRILILALGAWLFISGCDRPSLPANPAPVAQSSASSAVSTSSSAAVAVAAPASENVEAAGEQITETENADAGADKNAGLALRITEMKPTPSSPWKEGSHYLRLLPAQPTGALPGQVEVTEMFWYGCPHCYALDPFLENWRKHGKADYINLVRVPVMWGELHRLHARLYYTTELLGKLDELHAAIFQEIQRKQSLNTPEAMTQFFAEHGVNAADFRKAFNSFAVDASLKRAEMLGLRYKIDSVPTLIINGKYVTDVGRAGGQQPLLNLLNDLARREHQM